MLSSIYYGEIQSDKLVSWNENKDPYNILVENNRVYKLGGWEFLDIANKLFGNEKQLTIRFIRRRALAFGDKLITKVPMPRWLVVNSYSGKRCSVWQLL